jgi:hypothetical protein
MNIPFCTVDDAVKSLGQKIVLILGASEYEEPVAKMIETADGVRVVNKVCKLCLCIKSQAEYSSKQWDPKAGEGECKSCQNPKVPDDMDMFEVLIPPAAVPGQMYSIMVNGQRVELLCPSNRVAGTKLQFHLPKNTEDASKVKLKRCKTCNISKPKGGYSTSQWSRIDSGLCHCVTCAKEELKQTMISPEEQIKNLLIDNLEWRKKCQALQEERDDALAKLKMLESKSDDVPMDEAIQAAEDAQSRSKKKISGATMNPDGTMNAPIPPIRTVNGQFKHPTGKAPVGGYKWDYDRGLWVPTGDRILHDGFEFDIELKRWKILEGPDPKRRRRCKLNPDGTLTPVAVPTMLPDGTFVRQKGGRTPKGYGWDSTRGLWVKTSELAGQAETSDSEEESEE